MERNISTSDELRLRFDLSFMPHYYWWLRSALSGCSNHVGLDGYDNLGYNDPDYNDHDVMPTCTI